MRISIMAGGSSSRPDTLKQTGSAANLDKPLADGAGHTFLKLGPLRISQRDSEAGSALTPLGGMEFTGQLRHADVVLLRHARAR